MFSNESLNSLFHKSRFVLKVNKTPLILIILISFDEAAGKDLKISAVSAVIRSLRSLRIESALYYFNSAGALGRTGSVSRRLGSAMYFSNSLSDLARYTPSQIRSSMVTPT